MFSNKFQVKWPFGSEEAKNRFSRCGHRQTGGHHGVLIKTNLAISDLKVTPMLPAKFQVNWPFVSGEEGKNRFSRWPPWRLGHLGFLIRKNLAIFIYKSPQCFPPNFKSIGLLVQEKKQKIDFRDGGHLGFQIGIILAFFDLVCLCWGFTAQSTQWGHVERGQFT